MLDGIVGVPTGGVSRWSAFFECLIGLQTPPNTGISIKRGNSVSENRNAVIREALATEAKWIFFLDDDLLFDPSVLSQLLAHDLDAVVGLSLRRKVPFQPLAYGVQDEKGVSIPISLIGTISGLIEIQSATAGGVLIKRKVFESMADPWFDDVRIGKEDLLFYKKMREAGFKLHLDLDTVFGHITDMSIWPVRSENGWTTKLIQSKPFVDLPPAGAKEWTKNGKS